MTYRITLTHPCGTRQIVNSLSEATLLMRMGWTFVALRGRSFTLDTIGPLETTV
ncbi:hypothetical protein [Lichenicoccus sp.]|uniref:hypothetical protein n=1 Tax=Lichenicoccus sp. TaxID=2781899 RepID=UPI003D118839